MKTNQLKKGDRIRLKVKTVFGWKGTGTVIRQNADMVSFQCDGETGDLSTGTAMRWEVSKIRTP